MPKKLSQLEPAAPLGDADTLPLVQDRGGKKTVLATLIGVANFVIGKLTFATKEQAEAAESQDTFMSPVRVREFCESRGFGGTYTNANADLNTAVTGGFFSWNDASENTPVVGSYGRGMTLPSGGGYLTQIGVVNEVFKVYIRYQNGPSPSDRSAWTLVAQPIP